LQKVNSGIILVYGLTISSSAK